MSDEDETHEDEACKICEGAGWVCEDHPNLAWGDGCGYGCFCGAAGKPCKCNKTEPPWYYSWP